MDIYEFSSNHNFKKSLQYIILILTLIYIWIKVNSYVKYIQLKARIKQIVNGLVIKDGSTKIHYRRWRKINDSKYLLFDVTYNKKFFDYTIMKIDFKTKDISFTLYGYN